jgi:hypothetical protein
VGTQNKNTKAVKRRQQESISTNCRLKRNSDAPAKPHRIANQLFRESPTAVCFGIAYASKGRATLLRSRIELQINTANRSIVAFRSVESSALKERATLPQSRIELKTGFIRSKAANAVTVFSPQCNCRYATRENN